MNGERAVLRFGEEARLRHSIIALAVRAVPGAALAQEQAGPTLPTRQTEIHNHTDLTISRLSLRRLAAGPEVMADGNVSAEVALSEAADALLDAAESLAEA